MTGRVWLPGLAAVIAACAASEPPAPSEAQTSEEAQARLAPFKAALMGALQQGLAAGPAAAVEACQLEAPAIAESASRDGVRVGRTSHRLRNPANASPAWVVPVLETYLNDPAKAAPVSVALADGQRGYVEPIRLAPLCTGCHGNTLTPAVSARIDALYPDDQATGFAVGDLRGVFWVELPRRRPSAPVRDNPAAADGRRARLRRQNRHRRVRCVRPWRRRPVRDRCKGRSPSAPAPWPPTVPP